MRVQRKYLPTGNIWTRRSDRAVARQPVIQHRVVGGGTRNAEYIYLILILEAVNEDIRHHHSRGVNQ